MPNNISAMFFESIHQLFFETLKIK